MPAKLEPRVLKGFRDYLPAVMLPKQGMLDRVAEVFQSFGFAPLQTPALEYSDLLLGKYGDEGNKLLYRFHDNGDRDVALRYDLTVPLARVIGMNKGLALPFKRYQIAPVWRAENPARGRFREFVQCDIDIVGSNNPMADAECMAVGAAVLEALGVERFVLRVNNRKLLTALMNRLQISDGEPQLAVLRTLDKLPKIGKDAVTKLLHTENSLNDEQCDAIFAFLALKPEELEAWCAGDPVGELGARELNQVLSLLEAQGLRGKVELDLSIARGLDYYTGTIYETFLLDLESIGSVMSGGRYDTLIGMFGGEGIPAVGISLGVDRLFSALTELGLVREQPSPTQVLVTVFDAEHISQSYAIANGLRKAGIKAEVYLGEDKLKKQLKYADRYSIPYVVVQGPDECEAGEVTFKVLAKGEQSRISVEGLAVHVSNLIKG